MTTLTKRAIAPLIIGLTMACHPFCRVQPHGGGRHTGRGAAELPAATEALRASFGSGCGQYCHCGLQVIGNVKPMTESGMAAGSTTPRKFPNTMWNHTATIRS